MIAFRGLITIIIGVVLVAVSVGDSARGGEFSEWPDSLRPFPPEPYSLYKVAISSQQMFTCSEGFTHRFLVILRGEGNRSLQVFENETPTYSVSVAMSPSAVLNLMGRFYRDDFFNWRPTYLETDFTLSAPHDSAGTLSSRIMVEPPSRISNHLAFAVDDYVKSVSWPGDGPYFVSALAEEVSAVAVWRFADLYLSYCKLKHPPKAKQ
jgi:hypothetical protein